MQVTVELTSCNHFRLKERGTTNLIGVFDKQQIYQGVVSGDSNVLARLKWIVSDYLSSGGVNNILLIKTHIESKEF